MTTSDQIYSMAKYLRFAKYHGLGNHFVITEDLAFAQSQIARKICDGFTGVGADGVIFIGGSDLADCKWQVFNKDGSEANMCGNGLRCVGKYLQDRGCKKQDISIQTKKGVRHLQILKQLSQTSSLVKVGMGQPILQLQLVPTTLSTNPAKLNIGGSQLQVYSVSMGNPHAVVFVEALAAYPAQRVGPLLSNNKQLFPQGVNVEFVEVISRQKIAIRVWERGVGETHACGTGACASVVAGVLSHATNRKVQVILRGGLLDVGWEQDGQLSMAGQATFIFRGEYLLSN